MFKRLRTVLTLNCCFIKMLACVIANESEAQRDKLVCPGPSIYEQECRNVDPNGSKSGIRRSSKGRRLVLTQFLNPSLLQFFCQVLSCLTHGLQSSDQRIPSGRCVRGCPDLGKGNASGPSLSFPAASKGKDSPQEEGWAVL